MSSFSSRLDTMALIKQESLANKDLALTLSFWKKLQSHLENIGGYIIRSKYHIIFFITVETWLLFLCSLGSGLEDWECMQLETRMGHPGCVHTALCKRLTCPHFRQFWQLPGQTIFQCNYLKPEAVSNCIYHCELHFKSYSLWNIHFNEPKMLT